MSTTRNPAASAGAAQQDFHPMEAIPYFRRFRPSAARNVFYTFLFNGLIGSFFWLMSIADNAANRSWMGLVLNLLVANVVGYTIHVLFGLGHAARLDARVRGHPVLTTAYYTAVSLLGVVGGFALVTSVLHMGLPRFLFSPQWIAASAAVSLVISAVLSTIFFARARSARAEAELQGERLRAERIEREAALANLRALQAQIEPHFLFNTLANVTSLIDPDPGTAKRMLESFIRFLRASLAATRTRETTLGKERELIAAYLDVLQVRMGARLRYSVQVSDDLVDFPIAPMLLQPVVENAISHGLEPKLDGGSVDVRAYRDGAGVVIDIADTGMGFGDATRGGVGLSNLRERLHALHGEHASLQILGNGPEGTLVRVTMPS